MKILIATDGSVYGDEAIALVGRHFKDADVTIVSVYETPMVTVAAPEAFSAGYNPILEKEFKSLAASSAARAAKNLRENYPQAAREITTRVLCGNPSQAIVEAAENWGANLIVTGSHGYGFWKRALLGSVSNEILHHASCSVLIARKSDDFFGLRSSK